MAILEYGPIVTAARGKLGGVVLSANRSAQYAKAWKMPANPGSPKQLENRGLMSDLGLQWRSLTTAEQAAWDALAAAPPETDYNGLGQVYLLSGFGWFCRILIRKARQGQLPTYTAPANVVEPPPTAFSMVLNAATGAAGEAVVTFAPAQTGSRRLVLFIAQAAGQGTNIQTNRYLILWEAVPTTVTTLDFSAQYFETFGNTQVGQRFFGILYYQKFTGIRSTPLATFTDVI